MAPLLRARAAGRELLDGERLDARELRVNLREMAMLNRLPGGAGTSVAVVRGLLDGTTGAAVLDVGIGSGDFASRLRRYHPAPLVLVDAHPEVMEIARRNLAHTNDVTFVHADARSLPLADGAVAVTHSSLVIHHLDPPDVVVALREMRRVARRGVVVNDLRRGTVPFLVTSATVLALARGRYTRHDGPLSARRAYTLHELDDLAAEAGLRPVTRYGAVLPRVTTVYQ